MSEAAVELDAQNTAGGASSLTSLSFFKTHLICDALLLLLRGLPFLGLPPARLLAMRLLRHGAAASLSPSPAAKEGFAKVDVAALTQSRLSMM